MHALLLIVVCLLLPLPGFAGDLGGWDKQELNRETLSLFTQAKKHHRLKSSEAQALHGAIRRHLIAGAEKDTPERVIAQAINHGCRGVCMKASLTAMGEARAAGMTAPELMEALRAGTVVAFKRMPNQGRTEKLMGENLLEEVRARLPQQPPSASQ